MSNKKPMTFTQQKYAIARVDDIRNKKRRELADRYKTTFTVGDLKKLLATNKLKLQKGLKNTIEITTHTGIEDIFDVQVTTARSYSGYSRAVNDEHKKDIDKLEKQTTTVKDKIMLGDQEEALKAIEKFSSS